MRALFKCSVAVWIATLFILIDPTLVAFGQATFFGALTLFFVPCNGIVFLHIMGVGTMIIGMAIGWAWGVISMKAALATRPAAQTNARLEQLEKVASAYQKNTQQATGQSVYTELLIFEGFMLDTRVTVTYFCMIGLFVYLVARIRVAAPKLALLQIFAIIVSDIFLTIGPLLPTFSGAIPSVLIKPAATAVGVGVVCHIVLFPESTSYLVLATMESTVIPLKDLLNSVKLSLKNTSAKFDLAHLQKTKAGVISAYKGLETSLGFLPLDISRGRWNAEDIETLKEPLRQLVIMFIGLLQLQITRVESKHKMESLRKIGDALAGDDTKTVVPEVGHNHIVQVLDLRQRFQHANADELLEKSLGAFLISCSPLFETCGKAAHAVVEAIHTVNKRRWFNQLSAEKCNQLRTSHEKVLKKLEEDRALFSQLTSSHLLDSHSHLFKQTGSLISQGDNGAPIGGLMFGLIFEERILGVATALEGMLSQVVLLEKSRTKTRIWFPTGLRNLDAWIFGKIPTPGVGAVLPDMENDNQELKGEKTRRKGRKMKQAKEETELGAQHQLNSLQFHGGAKRSTFGEFLLAATHWLGSTEGMYALRVLIVSIVSAVPAVVTSSAGFCYREKGLWALIMSQSGMMTYTADFVYGFVLRVIGTVLGGIIGMVCWYIGAGNGPGNSYGLGAIMALAIIPLMWGRLFAPPALMQGVMLTAATVYLVVAYSWVDTHIPSYGNPGVGYSVFWRRTPLVLIGFTTSAIVIFIPRPPSASRHYRRLLSGSLRSSKDLHALYMTSWYKSYSDLKETSEKQILANAETLASIAGPIGLLKFEFSSTDFDAETLTHVTNLCATINQSLGQLLIYSPILPEDLKARFSRFSGAIDERFVGELMGVLTLLELSLKTGDPLPALLPVPLMARCAGLNKVFANEKNGHIVLTMDMIKEEGFRKYCVVLSAFVQMLSAADEMVFHIKAAVGETHLIDVEEPFLSRAERRGES